MNRRLCALLGVAFILAACSDNNNDPVQALSPEPVADKSPATEHHFETSGDIDIYLTLDTALGSDIKVLNAGSKKPGLKNHVETSITLQNLADTTKEIYVSGDWQDARGNGYGGSSSPLTLLPDEARTINTGTRAKKVTAYRVSITSNSKTGTEHLSDVLADPAIEVAEGYGMTYSATALDEVIPALPIFGFANGEPFAGKTVTFNYDFGKWRIEISDGSFDPLQGAGIARFENKNLQTISVYLPREPTAGEKLGKEMEYGGGVFQILDPGKSVPTTTWNTSLAYAIEFSEWNKGETAEGSCGKREVGSASGKLYIAFEGSEFSFENSWVSGEFNSVPVIYCGVGK